MTRKELVAALREIAPVAHLKFTEEQTLPFMAYGFDGSNDFGADNRHYYKIKSGWLEYYSKKADFDAYEIIDSIFENEEIPYVWQGTEWLDEERMVQSVWEFELSEDNELEEEGD